MITRAVLIRHAIAAGGSYAEDRLRPLSPEGRKIQERASLQLLELEIIPSLILCSPFRRTVETAQILAAAFGAALVEEPLLAGEYDPERLAGKLVSGKTLFLVGHAPTLAHFSSLLLAEPEPREPLSNSTALVIDFTGAPGLGSGRLYARIDPDR